MSYHEFSFLSMKDCCHIVTVPVFDTYWLTCPGVDLSEEECLYLYALGPSCRTLSKCDGPETPMSYSTFITKQLIQHSNISHDALVGLRLVDRDQLRVGVPRCKL